MYIIQRMLQTYTEQKSLLTVLNLLYFSHAWMLAIYNEPMCRQSFVATRWGPRIPDLFLGMPLGMTNLDALYRPIDVSMFSADERSILDSMVDSWGKNDEWQLNSIAITPDTPWDRIRIAKGEGSKIPNDMIKDHYKAVLEQTQAIYT